MMLNSRPLAEYTMKNEFFLEFEVGDYVFIVENNGTSVWGYLTEKNGDILRDVFI